MPELTPDQHVPKLYRARKQAWAVCACTWQSGEAPTLFLAQRAWAAHVAEEVVKASKEIYMPELTLMVGSGWKTSMPWLKDYGFDIVAGDTKLIWDSGQEAEIANARRTFNDLVGRGYSAFAVRKNGERGARVQEFDEDAESLILVPQLAGG